MKWAVVVLLASATPAAADDEVVLDGGFWLNYTYNLFDQTDRDKVGDFGPGNSMFRLGFTATKDGVIGSFRARWYSYARVWEYGWVGYHWSDGSQLEVGMTKVPFGLLPYSAFDYWFDIPYYLGFNNQYDLGVKYSRDVQYVNAQVGFFKNSDIAADNDLARFSYDTVTLAGDPTARNEEANQGNARVTVHGRGIEAGGSYQYGGLYNHDTGDTGHHRAAALHASARYGSFRAQLEAIDYIYKPKNAPGVARDVVVEGAFADAYPIAARGRVFVANAGYAFHPYSWTVEVYDNFSTLLKSESTFADSQMNSVGVSVLAGPLFGFVDLISAKNAPYIGTPTAVAFTTGDTSGWHSMFNINIGFYFKTDALAWTKR